MDYEVFYGKLSQWFKAKKIRLILLKFIYKAFPNFVLVTYPLLLGYLIFMRDSRLLRCITVPLGVFITLSLIRKYLNFQRPYEKYNITPLFPKSTKGKSFPSRHTASSAVISMVMLYLNIPVGIIFLLITAFIAMSRICGGVHFPRDVIVGYLYAVILGGIFLFIL